MRVEGQGYFPTGLLVISGETLEQ